MKQPTDYRIDPPLAHRDFLILSDLLLWLQEVIATTSGPVLDFGCGDSPYRAFFSGRSYSRADISGVAGLDLLIHDDETIDAPGGAFGTILSTQVLEHVDQSPLYLQEAFRVLTPGGRLLLSTHGLFEEHGHPQDFRRWTLTGLIRDIERAGFVIERADKLTVGARALGYVLGSQIWKLNPSRKTVLGFCLQCLRRFIASNPMGWNRFIDATTVSQRMISGPDAGDNYFIGVAIVARKP